VDLTNEEPREARFAAGLARDLGAEILLLHVVDYVPIVLPIELPGGQPLPPIDLVRQAAQRKLDGIAAKLGVPHVRTLLEVGGAADSIVEVAKREGVDQIVIGSHSRRAIARWVLGSVADRVAHTAECPVTIVR
jgi:nucleotide-binding universal stress UspA family protein